MPRPGKFARVLIAAAAGAAIIALLFGWPWIQSAALLMDLSGALPTLRRLIPVRADSVTSVDLVVPTRHGEITARMYRPASGTDRAIVLVPGVHAGGADEPRLDRLARRLAGAGASILSVPLPDLRAYRITPDATDMIEDSVLWMSRDGPGGDARVGLLGVSFAGGLAVVAAGRPTLRDRLTAVVSLGGHGDLPRTMRYLCTGVLPDGAVRPQHDYGVAILLRAAVPKLVPEMQRAPLDAALVAYLDASSLVASEPARATALFDASRAMTATLDEPARTIMRWVDERAIDQIGPRLLPWIDDLGGDPALSPERSPLPSVPIFLLHGLDDNVIPSSETTLLGAHISRAPGGAVQTLLTPLVTHADMRPGFDPIDGWRLVRLWTRIWRAFAPAGLSYDAAR